MGWVDDHFCMACGKENPDGLKVDFEIKDGKISCKCAFQKRFQGYANIVHGGMIGLMLDEVMVNLPWKIYKVPVVSAELNVRLKKPVKVGEEVYFSAEIE